MKKLSAITCMLIILTAVMLGATNYVFAPSPILDSSFIEIGSTPDNLSRTPDVFTGYAGDKIYVERHFFSTRRVRVTFKRYYLNEFGPIEVAGASVILKKGETIRRVVVTIPLDLQPQFWSYVTLLKLHWWSDPLLLPDIRVCVLKRGQIRLPNMTCPTRLNVLGQP